MLCPEVIRDLRLHEYGLRIVERRALNFLPRTNGSYLLTRAGQIREGIARISPADAASYPAYEAQVTRVGDFVRSLLLRTPPNVTHFEKRARLPELLKLLRMGSELRSFDKEGLIAFHELMTKSAGDYLDRWFESTSSKLCLVLMPWSEITPAPTHPGSAYVLLHHTIGGVNGRRGVWGHAIGGMGAITQAMAKAAMAAGAEISIDSPVNEVVVERDRVAGVVLEDGTILRAASVASNVTPKLLYGKLVPAGILKPDFMARIDAYRCHSATFRMNLALSELAELFSFTRARGGRSSHVRHYPRAKSRIHGPRLLRGKAARMEPRANNRNAYTIYHR